MSEISLDALQLAVKAVEDGLDDYRFAEEEKSRLLLSVRDGVIQRFEVAMDLSRQLLVRILKEKYFLEEAAAKKDTFREAAQLGMIADAETWLGLLRARNSTSHTYDSEIAKEVFTQVPIFLDHSLDLLTRLPKHVA
jgi:nucleotidyltransferase substrate binding protein (TIGR01987 family)